MILMRILPGVLKELSKHVPSVLFQTVEWNELVHELPKISRRVIKKEDYRSLIALQGELLRSSDIVLTQEAIASSSVVSNKWLGKKLLTLYFMQLFSPHGLFLDLRSNHFVDENPLLKFHPTGLWTKFDEDFRLGLLKVYDGFYLGNEEIYYEGLEEIGLLKHEWPHADKEELGSLFKAQFGNALTEEMFFDLENFKNAIIKMSNFMLNKKVKISKDFLYLGIYLVTLYATLEETREKLPVKNIYLAVREKFNKA
jgi:predicted unusual protein kinase regulating ubiquinone biosynthesis (AarF/ABC1/UbiB family)